MSTSKRTTEPDHNEEVRSWSDAAKATTRRLVDGGEFIPRDDKLHLKHIDSKFGYIAFPDLLNGVLRVVDKRSGEERVFDNVDALIREGWVID